MKKAKQAKKAKQVNVISTQKSSLEITRLARVFAHNAGVAFGLVFIIFTGALMLDFWIKPSPSFTNELIELIANHGNRIGPAMFIAITFPMIWQYNGSKFDD